MNISELTEKLNKLLIKKGKSFGKGKFYQSYEPLEIIGQRPTEERFNQYNIKKILRPDFEVLDIGCNCGFFSLYVAKYVKEVHGIEPNRALCEAGRLVSNYSNVTSVKFFNKRWTEFKPPTSYDLILSLAAHKWVKMPFEQYIVRCKSMLKPGGYFFIESHHLTKYDTDWNRKLKFIESKGFTQLWSGDSSEEGRPREFVMFRFT
jgi:cyclopropane fatty-acyl-phospholipid synthase-like methyltransferase